ncbi:M23 family metallopeptidase [Streptomyces sp. MUM 178J]|uniref:M23 family metallopeptidase n=1 Tax=Streptomyces sp. MUM 178J TaxID=2791991 RepID=UPI001F03F8D6|nr:M23 family metallopeptidase [Streptomyces sp. MUM 178J]WRQ83062.1 M23 family metallopeptidase [Streptomyces sp. MUM 178J]
MASNTPAPEAPFESAYFGERAAERSWGEWNPTEDSVRPVRGRHRVVKQRGGLARSSTVLGVGVIAAVGAGGLATAQDKPAVSISLPDLPDAESLPGVGALIGDAEDSGDADGSGDSEGSEVSAESGPAGQDGAGSGPFAMLGSDPAESSAGGAGEALRARILQQAEQQQAAAEAEAKAAAEQAAAEKAAAEAAKQQEAAEAKAAEEKRKAEEAARAKAEAERLAKLAASYSLPTSSYTITSTYGQAGSMWSSGQHTGLDFAAPTGTPVKAVHGGTVKSAGWSGSYGYRIVLELEDGTEVWYAHLSSMTASAGQKVTTGETIGRVGATGNVTGPHLHLEVHTPSGAGVDPMAWLRDKGLTV